MYYALYLLASLKQNDAKERYLNKIKEINGQDPYEIPKCEWEDDVESWPDVSYIHVGMYLLFSSSPYTKEQLMNYKSLDCYQNFANGWVREILSKRFGENCLLIAKVSGNVSAKFLFVTCLMPTRNVCRF